MTRVKQYEATWRPAPALPEVTGRLERRRLTLLQDGEVQWTLPFEEVAALRFVRHGLGRQKIVRLEMTTTDGALRRLEISTPASAKDPVLEAFLTFVFRVLAQLARHDPDLPIAEGERKGAQAALFALGLAVLVFAVGIGLFVGLSGDWLAGAPVALAGLVGGGTLAANNRPGRTTTRPLGTLIEKKA